MENKEVIIKTDKLSKSFSVGGKQQHVIKNLDLEIYKGDFTVIVGSSGAGKSTLLYMLAGMDKPSLGKVNYCGEDITDMNDDKLAVFRRKHCGFVFQQIHLVDSMSVMDNVISTGMLIGQKQKDLKQKAMGLFEKMGISEELTKKFPAQLSGGEAQRAAVIRALINDPEIVFADEPTGALNSAGVKSVLDVLTDINNTGQTVVMVTHDIKSVRRGNRIIYLQDGGIMGECEIGRYVSGDKERHEKIRKFLEGMGW
ncbi:ABC transporter ATP-binding protein [Ruminococcus flavefaciens]|uniref:ABC transporter ATP-binding protein n=1 Tax=Ruminococcus flavefaciens TaxID=1265 RepID=UPI0026F047ED|nr:ABC transporter ATP-binding protein [Ruminococcus flavefaciens]MDD7515894.1 ABC transporter ATP-binding protein [Ruminococcus flavefaciens]MDY5691775.1 ABC transporter ATP-binding protein [Ruminococcus flavefaciens]